MWNLCSNGSSPLNNMPTRTKQLAVNISYHTSLHIADAIFFCPRTCVCRILRTISWAFLNLDVLNPLCYGPRFYNNDFQHTSKIDQNCIWSQHSLAEREFWLAPARALIIQKQPMTISNHGGSLFPTWSMLYDLANTETHFSLEYCPKKMVIQSATIKMVAANKHTHESKQLD